MKARIINNILLSAIGLLLTMCNTSSSKTDTKNQLARLAVIEVDSSLIESYNEFLIEEVEASIKLEPGVITLYAIAEKNKPQHVTLFETYGDSSEYQSHLKTPHFQKYKQGTLDMVKHLDLIPMQEILYHRSEKLSTSRSDSFYIRLIKLQIDPDAINKFKALGNDVMLPGVKNEPGVLVMYALAEKEDPSKISILEVYESINAYEELLESPHYKQYKESAEGLVKSLEFTEVNPLLLGSKPQH